MTPGEIQEFLDDRKYCEPSINRKKLMSKFALVSKRIIEDGWKVGYMKRTETTDERDRRFGSNVGRKTKKIDKIEYNPVIIVLSL